MKYIVLASIDQRGTYNNSCGVASFMSYSAAPTMTIDNFSSTKSQILAPSEWASSFTSITATAVNGNKNYPAGTIFDMYQNSHDSDGNHMSHTITFTTSSTVTINDILYFWVYCEIPPLVPATWSNGTNKGLAYQTYIRIPLLLNASHTAKKRTHRYASLRFVGA